MSTTSPLKDSPADAVRQLQNRLPATRVHALKILGQLGEAAVEYLPSLKGCVNDVDQSVRLAAAQVISQLGESGLPAMARMLSHPDKYVRRQAVWGLGRLGALAKPALPELCQALKDADPRMATGAAQTIGGMGEAAAGAIPELAAAMRGTNVVLCRLAAKALSQIGMPALPMLLAELRHHDVFVRGEAATAVGWMGPKAVAAVPALVELLSLPSNCPHQNPDDSTPPSNEDAARAAAATALGRMGPGGRPGQTLLQAGLADPCPTVRLACEQALRLIGSRTSTAISA
jgi:HEAT repeat protein